MADELLRVTAGPATGAAIPVDGELELGRDVGGAGRLADPQVSGRHAVVSHDQEGRLAIRDLRSLNGTFVNGQRVTGPRVLTLGDVVKVGQTELVVQLSTRSHRIDERDRTGEHPREREVEHASDAPPPASYAPSSEAMLLHSGQRIPLSADGVTIGRADDNTLVFADSRVSRQHARFETDRQGFYVCDLGSSNGTYLNGERLHDERRQLRPGDSVMIASEQIRFLSGDRTRFASRPNLSVRGTENISLATDKLRLGRDASNDVVLADPNVSRFHAEVSASEAGYVLYDLGSRNGTRLNGRPIRESALGVGSEIGIGPFRLIFDGSTFLARDDRGALRLSADQVTVDVKEKRILDHVSLDVEPGEFVAVIGESGSGKTTLMKALAGVSSPTDGSALLNGEPVQVRIAETGYVPQDEITQGYLSVREALTYAARLRLPQDSTQGEIDAAVDAVLTELSLSEHAETWIASLSGGQRKRVGVGTELVNRPGLLFLDEPTTGLDPALERRMMRLMRHLANNARAVIASTHTTRNLHICDKVAVMGRGGKLCFYGAPSAALTFFGVEDYDGIYDAFQDGAEDDWRERWLRQTDRTPDGTAEALPSAASAASAVKSERRIDRQTRILTSRYAKLTVRDRRNMLILLGQVPLLALLISALYQERVFGHHSGQVASASELVFLLVTLAVWFGSIDAAREIIKERAVYERERAVGVRMPAYVLSKALVLFGLAATQTLLLCLIVLVLRPLDEPPGRYVPVIVLLVATAWVAVMMGLFLSALVNTENQAISLLPIAVIPQFLLTGQIKQIHQLSTAMKIVAGGAFSRWSFAGLGSVLDFNSRFAEDPAGSVQSTSYGGAFFSMTAHATLLILLAFSAVFASGIVIGLARENT